MTRPSPPLLLDDQAREMIVLPLHEARLMRGIRPEVDAPQTMNAIVEQRWDQTRVGWNAGDSPPGPIHLTWDVDWRFPEHRRLIVALTGMPEIRFGASVVVDGRVASIITDQPGRASRTELSGALPPGRVTHLRLTVDPSMASGYASLLWVALSRESQDVEASASYGVTWDPTWPGLLVPAERRGDIAFRRGLLIDASGLDAVRRRRDTAYGRRIYPPLLERAREIAARPPEPGIGPYLPWSDERYVRPEQRGRRMISIDTIELAFVAILEQDPELIDAAARYLMSILHTRTWSVSAEHEAVGSTWNQRCFSEELATTAVALAADWLDFALTDAARALVNSCLWSKGLSVLDRDLMQYRYMHRINQGAWFCRGKVLGGLMLESAWPETDGYVDRAAQLMTRILGRYVEDDGSISEGMGYFLLTLHMVLPAFHAYGRARNLDPRGLLPPSLSRSGDYLAAFSGSEPGRFILDGDNASDRGVGDGLAMLAALFPEQPYRFALAAPANDDPHNYLRQYMSVGPLGLLLGPDQIPPPRITAPTFMTLATSGHLASFRTDADRSVRLHVTGAAAKPSHSHYDKGAVTLELDGQPTLVDRGVIRYEDIRLEGLKASAMHNVITPVDPHGHFPDQARNATAVLVQGRGDPQTLEAQVDLTVCWPTWMSRCSRQIHSDRLDRLSILDAGQLLHPGPVAFHLHSRRPWTIRGTTAALQGPGPSLRVTCDWARQLTGFEDSIDHRYEPVYHLVAISQPVTSFELRSDIRFY